MFHFLAVVSSLFNFHFFSLLIKEKVDKKKRLVLKSCICCRKTEFFYHFFLSPNFERSKKTKLEKEIELD